MNRILPVFAAFALSLSASAVADAQTTGPSGTAPAPPQPTPEARGPSLDVAYALGQAAIAECKARGFNITVTVVDSAGVPRVTLRADGNGGSPAASIRKAVTAAKYGAPGSELEHRMESDPIFAAEINAQPDVYNAHLGSVPLRVGETVIGAIGIGSAPHDAADACAAAAVAALQSRLI